MVYTFEDKWFNMYKHISVLQAMSKKRDKKTQMQEFKQPAQLLPLTDANTWLMHLIFKWETGQNLKITSSPF